eukprot:2584188-Rhodomonas_salina.1
MITNVNACKRADKGCLFPSRNAEEERSSVLRAVHNADKSAHLNCNSVPDGLLNAKAFKLFIASDSVSSADCLAVFVSTNEDGHLHVNTTVEGQTVKLMTVDTRLPEILEHLDTLKLKLSTISSFTTLLKQYAESVLNEKARMD